MSISHQDETAEERRVRVDNLLKKHTLQGICISCREPIFGDETMLDTVHGKYHAAPKTCVNGRD